MTHEQIARSSMELRNDAVPYEIAKAELSLGQHGKAESRGEISSSAQL